MISLARALPASKSRSSNALAYFAAPFSVISSANPPNRPLPKKLASARDEYMGL
jgi:hypothetical protein